MQTLREQIEQTNADIEKAQREYDLNKAAELKYGKLPQLQKQLEEEEKIAAAKKEDSLLRDRVTDEEIARRVCTLPMAFFSFSHFAFMLRNLSCSSASSFSRSDV